MFGSTDNNEYLEAGVHLKEHSVRREIPDCKYCMEKWVSEIYSSLTALIIKFNKSKKRR